MLHCNGEKRKKIFLRRNNKLKSVRTAPARQCCFDGQTPSVLRLPLKISSGRLHRCGVFLLKELPPEKNAARPGRAWRERQQASFQTGKPDVADVAGVSSIFLYKLLPAALPPRYFPFQSLPVSRGLLDQPPKTSSRQVRRCGNFLCCSPPPLQSSEGIKTKEGRNPGAGLPSLKTPSASAGL